MTLLHDAVSNGNLSEVEQLLFNKNIDVNLLDLNGYTALHIACSLGYQEIVEALLSDTDIDINIKIPTGYTALNLAYINRHSDIGNIVSDALYKDKVLKNREVPHSQAWLIDRMQIIGYKTDPRGMCAGIGRMARQAFLANDYDTFSNRIVSLNMDFTPEKFKTRLDKLEQETKKFQQQVVVEPNNLKKQIMFQKIRANQALLNDIHAFFTGISLRHKPEMYAGQNDIFDGVSVSQDNDSAASWLGSVALDEEPITEVRAFSGAYANIDEIKYFLDALVTNSGTDTYSMSLDTPDHTIELSYSPDTKWLLTDANSLPGEIFDDTEKIAYAIHDSLVKRVKESPTDEVFFKSTFFCTRNNEHRLREHLDNLETEPVWSNIHSRTDYSKFSILRSLMEKKISLSYRQMLCMGKIIH